MSENSFKLPPRSRYVSRKEWETACWRIILKSEDILELLITSPERHILVSRAAAIILINAGKTYQQIGEELWLSPQTISSIKKALKAHGYRSYRERARTERKKRMYHSLPAPRRRLRKKKPYTEYGIIQKL